MRGSRKFRWGGGGGLDNVIFVINVFHRGLCGPPSRSNWTRGPIASREGPVPVFLRKYIATSDFPRIGGGEARTSCRPFGVCFRIATVNKRIRLERSPIFVVYRDIYILSNRGPRKRVNNYLLSQALRGK